VATPHRVVADESTVRRRRAAGVGWDHLTLHLPAAGLVVGLIIHACVLIAFANQLWFVGDDWDFLLRRGTIPAESRGMFEPKNGHWSVLTILIYRGLFAIFGLRTYLPYALVTIVFHLAIAVLWYSLLRRLRARRAAALAGTWALLFLGIGGEAILYSAAMNHLGSILLALLALAARLRQRPLYMTVVPLLGSVMFSNTGIAAVFFVVTFIALDEGFENATKVVAVPAVSYVAWYALYGHVEANPQMPETGWDHLKIPQLAWQGMSASVGNAVGFPEAGPALLLAIVVGTFAVRTHKTSLKHLAWAGLLASVFMSTVLSLSRQFAEPGSGRYAYYTVAFLVPAFALCVEGLGRLAVEPRWLVMAVGGALLAGYAVNGVSAERNFTNGWLFLTRPERDRALGMVAAVDAGERSLNESSGQTYNPDVNPRRLSGPTIRPELPRGKATAQGRIDAEALFMVRAGTTSVVAPASSGLNALGGSFDRPISAASGCRQYEANAPQPALALATGNGTEISVTSDTTEIVTQLTRGDHLKSVQRNWPVQPGTVFISTTAKTALLFITFNGPGEYTICHS
jgi:hypothetical protein